MLIKPILVALMYKKYGYTCNALQCNFINKYYKKKISGAEFISIDPIKAQKYFDITLLPEYNDFLNEDLLIIGYDIRNHSIFFLSSGGDFYEIYDGMIVKRGSSFDKMIENIKNGRKDEVISMQL